MRSGKALRQMNKIYWYGLIVLAGLVGVVLLASGLFKPYTFLGSSFNPPQPAFDFSITDVQEQPFRLSAQKGNITLLFFGYTSCPDECPTTMAVLKQVKDGLGQQAGRVRFVLITIDPARDTPTVLQAYVAKFDPSFIGITGTESALQPIWQGYGVDIEKTAAASGNGYTFIHSTQVYLVDSQGNLRLTYSYGTPPAAMVSDIQHLLSQAG
jgi:protein SCO1